MESGTIVRESAEARDQEASAALEHEEAAKPELRGYLSLVCMSALLELNGEATWGELKEVLSANGVASERGRGTFKNSLQKTGKVVMDGKKWTATETGAQFVAAHTDDIEESHEKVTEKKLIFSPARYTIFKRMQEEAGPDGWLFSQARETSILEELADKFDFSHRNLSKNLYTYNQEGFTDQQRTGNTGNGTTITNIRLNKKGEAELEKIKTAFPEKVAALEAQWTIEAMHREIDNMCWELGEQLAEFEDISRLSQDELDAEIDRLAADMRGLMSRLDTQKV